MSTDELVAAQGSTGYSSEGDKLGSVEEIFVDQDTGEPEWIGVGTGMLGTKRVLVPVVGAERSDDGFRVPYSKEQVKETPDVDADEISQETEAQLYAHYGLEYSHAPSDTGLPQGAPDVGSSDAGATEGDLVRSEEELAVGKQRVQAGRARVRKWVDTEPVQADVELQRETARVTREPIDQPVSDAEIGEQEVEVPLSAEQASVQKQTVAKERIGVDKDVETETQTVSDEVRKERVEVEGDNVDTR